MTGSQVAASRGAPAGPGPRVLAALLALLTLPFVPGWLDFELARRGLLVAMAGIALLVHAARAGRQRATPPPGTYAIAALGLWLLLPILLGGPHPDLAVQRVLYLVTLGALYVAGARFGVDTVLRATVPVGILVAAYGTAQAFGLDVPAGFARPDQPISTLGNKNAASEFVTFALAGAMALAARSRQKVGVAAAAVVVLGLYVGLNGTRAGYVGTGLACALLAWSKGPAAARGLLVAAAAGSVLLGYGLRPSAPAPDLLASTPTAPATVSPSTIDVRFALWEGTLDLIADAPVAGHGAASFRTEYPRFRTQAEIEATSFGRRFPTFAENPHNELLEIAVEGGVPAVVLVLLLAWTVARAGVRRGRATLTDLAPLAAFAFACMVRAPMQNAPVAAVAALLAGALAGGHARSPNPEDSRSRGRSFAISALGLALVVAGTLIVLAATLASNTRDEASLASAARLAPGESRYRSLLIQAKCGGVDAAGLLVDHGRAALAACRDDLAALLASDPNNTNALFLAAQLGLGGGDPKLARVTLGRILELDRSEPRAQSLTAVLLAREGDVPGAIATLYARPHATLRARLAEVLTELTGLPDLPPASSDLLRREIRFVRAVDAVLADPAAGSTAQAILAVAGSGDPRGPILVAARLRALGQGREADALAPSPEAMKGVDDGSLRLLGPLLESLRGLPRWSERLPKPD
jgi:O-antigen ligase